MTTNRVYYECLILAEIDANLSKHIKFLANLVKCATPNPPGDTQAGAHCVKNFLSLHDVQSTTIAPVAHMPNVVADFSGQRGPGPRVIFNGHIDTPPANNVDNPRLNYSGLNDGISIHGVGAVDTKAGVAASIIAFTLLKKWAALLTGSVALTVVSDEGTGGVYGTRHLLENCGSPSPWKGDCVINGEPGGLQSVRFAEKGTLRLTFTVTTEGANGAYTNRSCGAIVYASALIVTLKNEIEEIPVDIPPGVRQYLRSDKVCSVTDEIMGAGAAANLSKATLNVGVIQGGVKVNVIPSTCVFEADIRLPIGVKAKTLLAYIDQTLVSWPGVTYLVQEAASHPSSLSPLNHPFLNCIADAAESVNGHRPIPLVSLNGTDCKFYRYHHIPAFVFGPSPSRMGADQDEAVLIDEYVAVIKTHTLAVFRYLWDGKGPRSDDHMP